jgi:hypothetical protein
LYFYYKNYPNSRQGKNYIIVILSEAKDLLSVSIRLFGRNACPELVEGNAPSHRRDVFGESGIIIFSACPCGHDMIRALPAYCIADWHSK